MKNEEKVEALVDELGIILGIIYTENSRAMIKKLLMKMTQWKDEQFVQEKEKLIDNVCEWLKNNIDGYMMTRNGEIIDTFDEMNWLDYMFRDLKESMKEV